MDDGNERREAEEVARRRFSAAGRPGYDAKIFAAVMTPPRLGISSCLLGHNVRYDGGNKLDHFLRDTLGRHVTFVPVCPEVECGLPVPREPMRLVGEVAAPRLVTRLPGIDLTDRLLAWAEARLRSLEAEDLSGFVFKSRSPSCGLFEVEVCGPSGRSVPQGIGLFAAAFTRHLPLLPVEEETRLRDAPVRESFVERLFSRR